MCTMITLSVPIEGSGKGAAGWFALNQAHVSYEHPFGATLEYALNMDFVNPAQGLGARVAVELSADAARALVETILAVLAQAEREGHLAPRSG